MNPNAGHNHRTERETRDSLYQRQREAGVPRDAARSTANEAAEKAHRQRGG